ncbi:MAG: type II toxin-antitoxin system RelE/ParE family toxin, partial [Candidatus Thermoplasmatota archaeon]|nr:type II toxin-antitoxin system RelE/ParE family toxin [Candidatus Thermoplasmatota archaeon]
EVVDADLRKRISDRLLTLGTDPKRGTRLKHSEFWRLRIGDYRAIYEIDHQKERVVILFLGHRREVYDDFSRLL